MIYKNFSIVGILDLEGGFQIRLHLEVGFKGRIGNPTFKSDHIRADLESDSESDPKDFSKRP
jgi:hypothetical protein